MPPRTRNGKRKASSPSPEDSKENGGDLTTAVPTKIKKEVVVPAILRTGFSHSTTLFPARRPGVEFPQDNSTQQEVAVKTEDTCGDNTLQEVAVATLQEVAVAPLQEVAVKAEVTHGDTTPSSLSQLQETPKVSVESVKTESEAPMEHIVCERQLDEVEEVKVEPKAVHCIDLTIDDDSPASTQPPSPVREIPDDLDNENAELSVNFSTPLIPFLDRSLLNLSTISALKKALGITTEKKALGITTEKKANSKDFVDLTASPITLDSSSSSSTPVIDEVIDKSPNINSANNIPTSTELSNSCIPMDISPICSPVKPMSNVHRISNSELLNTLKNFVITDSSIISKASQFLKVPPEKSNYLTTSNLDIPISYSQPQSSAMPQEHIGDPTRNVTAYHSPSHSVPQENSISSTSNLNTFSSQNKRKLPEDPRQNKKLNIQDYQKRKSTDPRLKSSNSLTSTPSPVSSPLSSSGYSHSPQYSPPMTIHPQHASYGQYQNPMSFAQPITSYPSSLPIRPLFPYASPYPAPAFHPPTIIHPITCQRFLPRMPSLGQGSPTVPSYPMQPSQRLLIPPRVLTNEERTSRLLAEISGSELNAPSPLLGLNLPSVQEMQNVSRHMAVPQPSIPVPVPQPSIPVGVPPPAMSMVAPRPVMSTVVQEFRSCIPKDLRDSVGTHVVDTELLHLLILDWDVTSMYKLYMKREFPRLATEICQVRNSYVDHLDYYNTYFPLMLVEHWNRIFKEYYGIQRNLNQYYFVISQQPEDLRFYEDGKIITTVIQSDSIVKKTDRNTGLKSEVVYIQLLPNGPKFFGYVRESSHRSFFERNDCNNPTIVHNGHALENRDNLDKVRLNVEVACERSLLKENNLFLLSKVVNLNTLLKQNNALRIVEESTFKGVVLNPLMGNIELFKLPPSGKQLNLEADTLSSMTDRVCRKNNQMTLVAVSELANDQFHALGQVVRYLRHRFQPRLLVVCPESKMRDVGRTLNQLGFELVILEREVKISKHPGEDFKFYDRLIKKSSPKTVLEDCEVMLVPSSSSFHPDIVEKGAEFDTCILFDAHHVTEPESVAPLAYNLRHFVALGVPNKFCKTCDLITHYDYRKSLFQRMFETCQ